MSGKNQHWQSAIIKPTWVDCMTLCHIVPSHLSVWGMHQYTAPPEDSLFSYSCTAFVLCWYSCTPGTVACCYLPLLPGATDHTAKCEAGEHQELAASLANICYVSVLVT